MPSPNIIRNNSAQTFYHVYSRGVNRSKIFVDELDFRVFRGLFDRYLGAERASNSSGIPYPNFRSVLEINAYCLMPNHFHLLLYQVEGRSIEAFMQCLLVSYSRYFNKRHHRSGALFESRYKAVRVDSDAYLTHLSRYIHRNPERWQDYLYSSLESYRYAHSYDWLNESRILESFSSREAYFEFCSA